MVSKSAKNGDIVCVHIICHSFSLPVASFPQSRQRPVGQGRQQVLGEHHAEWFRRPPGQYTQLWSQATAENGCKWGSIEGTEGKYNWGACDVAYNWAKKNNRIFKFHALIWGGQYPSWLKNKNVDQTKSAIDKWFAAVKAKYPI